MGPGWHGQITQLLAAWGQGDRAALEQLAEAVDGELRRIARSYLSREPADPVLQTTAIINEVYLRLLGGKPLSCGDRAHFYAVCARIMRRILVDHARARRAAKRGSGASPTPIEGASPLTRELSPDVIAIDDALTALSRHDPRKGQVVELRFFGGLSVAETAQALSVSEETVIRDWRLAKLWLLRELKGG